MNRASTVYGCLFAIFAAGIWAILHLGSHVAIAPDDLSGKWQSINADISMQPPDFVISQSGRYFQLTFDDGSKLNLILQTDQTDLSQSRSRQLTLEGQGWQVAATGLAGGNDFQFTFHPPSSAAIKIPAGQVEYRRADPSEPNGGAPASNAVPKSASSNSAKGK